MRARLIVAAVLVVSLPIVLVGCGEDDSGAASTSADTTATTTPTLGNSDVEPAQADPPTEEEMWPAEDQQKYIEDCEASSGGKSALCRCVLDAFQSTMTIERYNELLAQETIAPDDLSEETVAGASYCTVGKE